MSCPVASVAFTFALVAGTGIAAETDAMPAQDVERMTPVQLRALQARLERRSAAARDENAALRRRIEELELRNAAHDAKNADLDARLARVQERLANLKAEHDD